MAKVFKTNIKRHVYYDKSPRLWSKGKRTRAYKLRRAFNTETSDEIARRSDYTLFKTRSGKYFLARRQYDFTKEQPVHAIGIQPLSIEQAKSWLKENFPEGYDEEFVEQREVDSPHGIPVPPETRFTLRIPGYLKSKIDDAAKSEKRSVNAWINRELEKSCAERLVISR